MERKRFKRTMKALGYWRGGELDAVEPVSHFRKYDRGSVTLIEPTKGYWVDGGPPLKSDDIVPVIDKEQDRIQSIINNTPTICNITENPNADSSELFFESSLLNPIDDGVIYDSMGAKYRVNSDWLKTMSN